MARFSICIPTYEMGGYGFEFLDQLLTELKQQTFQDFDVVISDQSSDEKILNVCSKHTNDIPIHYTSYQENKGKAACNINNAMKNASGEIIKILYQDDFFVSKDALSKINEQFNLGSKWVVNGFTHSNDKINFFNTRIPFYGDHVLIGENTIGNPSNISVINKDLIFMDESILYVVDCEYYFRLNQQYGPPTVIDDILVCARHHPVSAVDRPEFYNLKGPEVEYCLKKHNARVVHG